MKRALALALAVLALASTIPPATAAEPRPGEPLWVRALDGIVVDLDWSPDGELLAVAQGQTWVVDVYDTTGTLQWRLQGKQAPRLVAWSPEGGLLAVAYGRELVVYNVETRGIVAQRKFNFTVTSLSWSPTGDYLALTTEGGEVWVFDRAGEPAYLLTGPNTPTTTSAWTPDGRFLLVGDGTGQVIVYDMTRPFEFKRFNPLGEAVTSIAVSPEGVVAVSSRSKTLLGTVTVDGVLSLTISVSYGASSQASWSPDGEALALPDNGQVVVVGPDGSYKGTVPGAGEYPVSSVAWNPVEYALLAVAGYSIESGDSRLALVYSGALYTLEAADPVVSLCRLGSCGQRLTVAAWEKTVEVNVTLPAREWPGMEQVNATLTITLEAHPFETRTITVDAWYIASSPEIRVPGGKGLLLLFRAPDATAVLEGKTGEAALEGIATLAPPGDYTLVLSLEEPPGWLGPQWALTRRIPVTIPAGGAVVLNYTWYTVGNVTATLQVETEPGTLLALRFKNDTVQTIVESRSKAYTVPTGSYVVSLQLPTAGNVLVASPEYLAVDKPVTLYPGDVLHIALHYGDLLGRLRVEAPAGTRLEITPPWSQTPTVTAESQGAPLEWWAQPGGYRILYTVTAPEGWLGPEPPSGEVNVTVETGATARVSLYDDPRLQEFLSLLDSSARITVDAPAGYTVIVEYDNKTLEVEPGSTLVAPPGNYTFTLLAGDGKTVLDTEKVRVEGPGEITVKLQPPAQTRPGPVNPQPPPGETGRRVPLPAIIALALVPVIAGVAAYFLLVRRRQAGVGGGGYW